MILARDASGNLSCVVSVASTCDLRMAASKCGTPSSPMPSLGTGTGAMVAEDQCRKCAVDARYYGDEV